MNDDVSLNYERVNCCWKNYLLLKFREFMFGSIECVLGNVTGANSLFGFGM